MFEGQIHKVYISHGYKIVESKFCPIDSVFLIYNHSRYHIIISNIFPYIFACYKDFDDAVQECIKQYWDRFNDNLSSAIRDYDKFINEKFDQLDKNK